MGQVRLGGGKARAKEARVQRSGIDAQMRRDASHRPNKGPEMHKQTEELPRVARRVFEHGQDARSDVCRGAAARAAQRSELVPSRRLVHIDHVTYSACTEHEQTV